MGKGKWKEGGGKEEVKWKKWNRRSRMELTDER